MPELCLLRPLAVFTLLVALPVLAGAAPPLAANAKLRDTRWILQAVDGVASARVDRSASVHMVLHAATQRLSGFAGCNALLGRYVQRGTQLVVSAHGGTRKTCAPAVTQQEGRFIELLGVVDSYRIEGQVLSLLQGDTVRVSFQSQPLK